jgi:hypothetical protein
LGFQHFLDALSTGFSAVRDKIYKDTTQELRDFLAELITQDEIFDRAQVENQINFFSPVM